MSLLEAVESIIEHDGANETGFQGLVAFRTHDAMAKRPVVYDPSMCVVVRGTKHAYLGNKRYTYDDKHYLVSSLTLPIEAEIVAPAEGEPFLALVLKIDPTVVGRLLVEMDADVALPLAEPPDGEEPALFVSPMHLRLENALERLVRSAVDPVERRLLAPAALREVIFHVLRSRQGHLLRDSALRDNASHRVARVVRYLEDHYSAPLDIAAIAKRAGMSSSALHHHFKRVTTLSPVQFLKKIRLHQARVMLVQGRSAGEAAFEVGYGSPSQFSREFRRLFGISPSQVRNGQG